MVGAHCQGNRGRHEAAGPVGAHTPEVIQTKIGCFAMRGSDLRVEAMGGWARRRTHGRDDVHGRDGVAPLRGVRVLRGGKVRGDRQAKAERVGTNTPG